jgi:hypothetical protein
VPLISLALRKPLYQRVITGKPIATALTYGAPERGGRQKGTEGDETEDLYELLKDVMVRAASTCHIYSLRPYCPALNTDGSAGSGCGMQRRHSLKLPTYPHRTCHPEIIPCELELLVATAGGRACRRDDRCGNGTDHYQGCWIGSESIRRWQDACRVAAQIRTAGM